MQKLQPYKTLTKSTEWFWVSDHQYWVNSEILIANIDESNFIGSKIPSNHT